MNPFQYTVQSGDYRGLNDIVRRFGFQDYKQAGISAVPSGNFDLIRPGDVINFGNQPRNMPGQNQGIVSTTQYRNDLNSAENSLNEFQNDPYMSLFQKMRDQNKQAEEAARLNAEAQANREKVQQEQKFVAGKAGTDSANIAGGLSRYAPELANSQTQQVFTRNLMKIEEIQGEEDLAIARAKDARAANDLDVMREELAYIQQLREAKAEAIAEANRLAFEREKFEEDKRQFDVREGRLGGGNDTTDEVVDDTSIVTPGDAATTEQRLPERGLLFKLAKKLKIKRTRNLRRSDDIQRLTEQYPNIINEVSALLDEGYTQSEILNYYSAPNQ